MLLGIAMSLIVAAALILVWVFIQLTKDHAPHHYTPVDRAVSSTDAAWSNERHLANGGSVEGMPCPYNGDK